MSNDHFENLPEEIQAKAKDCKTPEEMLELAREEGYELSDAELSGIAGGLDWDCATDCPSIGDYCRRDDDAF